MAKKIALFRGRKKILPLFISVLLIIGLGVVVYLASQGSGAFELRKKAAESSEVVYKRWDFNGTDTEGWAGKGLSSFKTENGMLSIITQSPGLARIENTSVATIFPRGTKSLKIRLGVTLPQPLPNPTSPNYSPPKFVFYVHYFFLKGGSSYPSNILLLQGIADGQLHDYELKIPDVLDPLDLNKLQIGFTGSRLGTRILIDWIALTAKPFPTPSTALPANTPTPTPTTGVVKRWDFNGQDTEGWAGKGFSSYKTENGMLIAVNSSSGLSTSIGNTNINAELYSKYKKSLGIRLSVDPPPVAGSNPYKPSNMIMYIYYSYQIGKNDLIGTNVEHAGTLPLQVKVDGQQHDLVVPIPIPNISNITKLRLQPLYTEPGTKISIDWILLQTEP